MKLLEGKKIADKILEDLQQKTKDEKLSPGLAVVLVGENEASKIYVGLKEKAARKVGINFSLHKYDSNVSEEKILKKINDLNGDKDINGILVQLPLPKHINKQRIIEAIDPKKDVDLFHPDNKKLLSNSDDSILPPFPNAILELIKSSEEELKGRKGMIICNSNEFGETMKIILGKIGIESEYVLQNDISKNIEKIRGADVIVTACGIPDLINSSMIKEGVIIADGGVAKVGDKVKGDVDFESIKDNNGYITPVPGGVGPVTVACLMENVYLLAKKQ